MDIREKRFLTSLRSRDPRAFEVLIEQHQSAVFNYIYRILGDRQEAEDLLQEVFISVFKKVEEFRGDSSLRTWIYRIATNHCINRKKYLAKRLYSFSESTETGQNHNAKHVSSRFGERIPGPEEMMESRETEQLIQQAISSLDEDQRMVLVLRDVQNLSYEEIEQILGVPQGTVKSRLHRARMELKERLTPLLT